MTTMEEHNDTGRCLEHHDDNCKDPSFITDDDDRPSACLGNFVIIVMTIMVVIFTVEVRDRTRGALLSMQFVRC